MSPIRDAALAALARREYSRVELQRKLVAKGFEAEATDAVLAELSARNLLSDQRFVESYLYAHIQKGQGPLRLRQGLRDHGVDDALIREALEENPTDWAELARQVREKRFGNAPPENAKDYARQVRFLSYRGFDAELVRAVLKHIP